jgi:hypothetical protein
MSAMLGGSAGPGGRPRLGGMAARWGIGGDTLHGLFASFIWEHSVKKGRHRRFEEARRLKQSTELIVEPCPECGAEPGKDHAAWCLATEDDEDEEEFEDSDSPLA